MKTTIADLKEFVLSRDRACMAAKLGFEHECRDVWGEPHAPTDWRKLSLEHVRTATERVPYGGGAMGGPRAPDDAMHTIAVCYAINLRPPSHEMRDSFRDHLAKLYAGG